MHDPSSTRRGVQLREDAKLSLEYLSPALQVEVVLHGHDHWLKAIWFMRDLDASVKVRIAQAMLPKVIAPGEIAPPRFLYVLSRGKVMYGGRILSRGNWWGDDVLLTDSRWFVPFLARAIIFTDVACVSSDTLVSIAETHTTSYLALRKSKMRLALRRAIVLHARGRLARERGFMKQDFMDKVDEAAKGLVSSDEQEKSMKIALELSRVGQGSGSHLLKWGGQPDESSSSNGLESKSIMTLLSGLKADMERMTREIQEVKDGQQNLCQQLAEGKQGIPMIRGTRLPSRLPSDLLTSVADSA